MILGLTGGYCVGKNAAAGLLESWGWVCIDVDRLGHEAIDRAQDQIVARFGPSILGAEGKIDRRALAAIVFSDRQALADQESIIHPIAIGLLDERIDQAERAALAAGREARICLNAALLYMAPQARRCQAVLELRAPLWVRLARARLRDHAGPVAALRRILRQRALWPRRRELSCPILVVDNGGRREALAGRLKAALQSALG